MKGLRRRKLLKEINVSRATQLTPKAKKLYRFAKSCANRMSGMQFSIKSYRTRLANAEKIARSENCQNLLSHVNESTYNFILCQIRNQKLPIRARRYTKEEKILALIVLKASGKGYRLLCKLFALPSTRTLTNLLNKIPLRPGINEQLFTSLQKTVSKMKRQQDKVCILMFDELSIETSINYDKKNDFIVGVEDFGSERCAALADHANVFMLKGLFRQWK